MNITLCDAIKSTLSCSNLLLTEQNPGRHNHLHIVSEPCQSPVP